MKRAHFIGIGGIGISALARCFLSRGWEVRGSDIEEFPTVKDLKNDGIKITTGVNLANIKKGLDLVVYSAVWANHPELKRAKALGIETRNYAEALGELTKDYFTIAVSGSHGKSTTTSMLSMILVKAGLDPTVIVGTKLKEFGGSNFRAGKSKYLVIEADEWNKSFLNYWPQAVILTNIDKEHLDTYGTEASVVKTFSEYVSHLPQNGILIANWQDKNSRKVALGSGRKIIFYNKSRISARYLRVPGAHNRLNAEAAWQAAKTLGVKKVVADSALASYRGAWRRLELIQNSKFKNQNLCVYSDYAHHPTEIKATLQALREKHPNQKIVCVFQPHQADRLTRLFPEFTKAFDGADEIVLLPIYKPKGRESRRFKFGRPITTSALLKNEKTSFDLHKVLKKRTSVEYCGSFSALSKYFNADQKNSVFVFMSAGDLDSWLRRNS